MSSGKTDISAEAVMMAMLKINDIRTTLAAAPDKEKVDLTALVSQIIDILRDTILKQGDAELSADMNRELVQEDKAAASDILLPEDPALLMKTCDEVRLHLLAVALLRKQGARRQRSVTLADAKSDPKQLICGPIVREEGGLIYARANGSLVMLLPEVHQGRRTEDLCSQLLKIFDLYGCRYNWLLDFSAIVHQLPPVLVGNLLAYQKALTETGRSLSVCWLKPSLLSGDFAARLTRIFDLREKGGHLFSADIVGIE